MAKNGRPFQMAFPNQREQQSQFLLQILKLQGNSTPSITVVYLCQLIQVFRGEGLISRGPKEYLLEPAWALAVSDKK